MDHPDSGRSTDHSRGQVLCRASLDEPSQPLDVLKGEMASLGPRMSTPEELRHFGHWRHNLLTVKPEIARLWQVCGRSDASYKERVRLDIRYVRNHIIWLDLELRFNTVSAVLSGKGARWPLGSKGGGGL